MPSSISINRYFAVAGTKIWDTNVKTPRPNKISFMLDLIVKVLTKSDLNTLNNQTVQKWNYCSVKRTNYYVALVIDDPDFAVNLLPEEDVCF